MTKKESLLTLLLEKEIQIFSKTLSNLEYTYAKCKNLNVDLSTSPEEQELLDSLASRFIRHFESTSKQLLRTSLQLLGENQNSFLDTSNKLAQLEFISSATFLKEFRDVRNIIAHEYLDDRWVKMYEKLLIFIPTVFTESQTILNKVMILKNKFS